MTRSASPHGRSWSGQRVCVAGLGVSGAASARALLDVGAWVIAVDARTGPREHSVAAELIGRGADIRLGDAETPVDADLVVTSPGWRPDQPLLVAAQHSGVEVIGEPELAWRLRPSTPATGETPWLGVTGTNGKTTTVGMLDAIVRAAGHRTIAAGNVGTPLVDVVRAAPAYDVIVVEMSSFQLHWSSSICFTAATILNIADDHLDWHGSFASYAADKAKIWGQPDGECVTRVVYNQDDPACARLAEPFTDRQGFSVTTSDAQFHVADGVLLDGSTPLASVSDIPVPGPHNVANAVAAAGMARQLNQEGHLAVPPQAIATGLRAYLPGAHRSAIVGVVDDVTYVDDSKATNPHAAAASLEAFPSVVWLAGGLLKGANVDELVAEHAHRLKGVVLIGRDRGQIAQALARHASDVPVVEVADTDTGAMRVAVGAARRLADAGDAVLLAPAAASMDMFADYAARGDAFAAAVRALADDA